MKHLPLLPPLLLLLLLLCSTPLGRGQEPEPAPSTIMALIGELSDDRFVIRQRARSELLEVGEPALVYLQFPDTDDLEVQVAMKIVRRQIAERLTEDWPLETRCDRIIDQLGLSDAVSSWEGEGYGRGDLSFDLRLLTVRWLLDKTEVENAIVRAFRTNFSSDFPRPFIITDFEGRSRTWMHDHWCGECGEIHWPW